MGRILHIYFLLFFYNIAFGGDCIEMRHVFELGSGITKITSYLFDKCQGNINKELRHSSRKMAYQKCLAESIEKKVDDICLKNGISAINELKKQDNVNCELSSCTGFATAWARDASNTTDTLRKIASETGVQVHVVSQEDEAKVAYKVAREMLSQKGEILLEDDNILLIDIGGGSYQITVTDPRTKQNLIYKGDTGTETLAKEMGSKFHHEDDFMIKCSLLSDIYSFYNKKISSTLLKDSSLISTLKENKNIKAYGGVGGSIINGLSTELAFGDTIRVTDIEKVNRKICGLSFSDVSRIYPKSKAEYMDTTQAILFLLHAIMKGLGIGEIKAVSNTNSIYYIVKREEYWMDNCTD